MRSPTTDAWSSADGAKLTVLVDGGTGIPGSGECGYWRESRALSAVYVHSDAKGWR